MAFTAARSQAFAADELEREIAAFERAHPDWPAAPHAPHNAADRYERPCDPRARGRPNLAADAWAPVCDGARNHPLYRLTHSRTAGAAFCLRERRSCRSSQVVGGGGRWSCHVLSARRFGSTRAARAARTPVTEMTAGVVARYAS